MNRLLILCGLCFSLLQICTAANIVVYMPMAFYSHQTAYKPLWLELARRGHKITLIQPDIIVENNENITHIVLGETHDLMEKFEIFDKLGRGESIIKVLFEGIDTFSLILEYQLMHPGVQELLKGEKKVDLLFTEYLATIGFAIGKKLDVPMIGLVSMDATIYGHTSMGNPVHPVLYPDKDLAFSALPTFGERVLSIAFYLAFNLVIKFVLFPLQERLGDKCLGGVPRTEEITRDISMMFINANPLFNVVRPLGPKTINVGGGMHLLEPQPLPEELQDYLDSAENGVIYFSLGSSINSKQMHTKTKKVILKTFSKLPYKILWKFDEDLEGKPENVKIMKWVPQQDVLRHKNVKLFITQGGLQSMEEAIFNYVPMIALPFYGDQHGNTEKMVIQGFGLSLDHANLKEKQFRGTILEVINNPKYRERTKELADLVKDQPMTGLEKAVWWTEYVLRHGKTDHLRNPALDIPWYQYFFLDVIGCFLLIVAVLVFIFIKTLQLSKWLVTAIFKKGCGLVLKLFNKLFGAKTKTKTG